MEQGSLYERLLQNLDNKKVQEEVKLGKRVGLYKLKGQLGKGNYSRVKLGLHLLTNERVAVKVIDKTHLKERERQILMKEIVCMNQLYHSNLIRLFEVYETFSHLYLIMEYAEYGNLHSEVGKSGPFSEDRARAIFHQVVIGLEYMHNRGITHRDIKSENVFYVSDTRVKIGDFGFSTPITGKVLTTFCGSPPYAAPELFQDDCYQGPPVDMWAVGVLLYYMLTKEFPFPGHTVGEVKQGVLSGEYTVPKELSTECQDLIVRLLTYRAAERPSSGQILQDRWLIHYACTCICGGTFDIDSKAELDTFDVMRELGMPVCGEDERQRVRLGEPRDAVSGTYRILLHRRLHSAPMTSDTPPSTALMAAGRLQSTTSDRLSVAVSSGLDMCDCTCNNDGSMAQKSDQCRTTTGTSPTDITKSKPRKKKSKKAATKSLRNKRSKVCIIS